MMGRNTQLIRYLFLFMGAIFCSSLAFASGNADVSIVSTSCVNGAWSYSAPNYTFTPTADGASVDRDDIISIFAGSGTLTGSGFTACVARGNVIILTACSGTGTQTGNVTTSATCTAPSNSSTQYTFTITAAGTITLSNAFNFTPGTNTGGNGYPGMNVTLTGTEGVAINSTLNCTGGACTTITESDGGNGGTIQLTSSGGAVSNSATINATGGAGSTAGGTTPQGGNGGNITIQGTSISAATLTSAGGLSYGGATGGAGGTITLTSTSTTIAHSGTITLTGGAGGNGSSAAGGAAGTLNATAATSITSFGTVQAVGGLGYQAANGGAGCAATLIATSGSITTSGSFITNGGQSGTTSGTGGAGGAITMTASSNVTLANAGITATGGAGQGGSANGGNGGNVTITATSGTLTTGSTITCNGGAGGLGSTSNGGTGGNISLTAGAVCLVSTGGTLSTRGGTPNGGTAVAGNVTLVGPTGVTLNGAVNMTATTTAGNLIINDGQTGAATANNTNDGQGTGYTITGGNVTKIGAGNFQMNAGGSWSGTTTITAGTLTLGASNIIPTTQVIMNGGTLSAGYAETMGTLMISDNSIIDLVSTVHTVAFAASNGITWTSGKMLTIKNWTGGYNGTTGTGPLIKTGASNELDATHLGFLWFKSGASWYAATQISTTLSGEVMPTGTLPVVLISFNAEKNKSQVDVSWTTASEINSSYYNVLRSTDNVDFEIINTTNAAGNSNSMLNYSFVDLHPMKGTNYYKLIEYDFDGQSQSSDVVAVEFSNANVELSAYPNPTIHSCTFDFQSENGGIYYLKAYNSTGQEVYAAKVAGISGSNKFCLGMADLAVGIYHFQLFDYSKKIAGVSVVRE
jgi:hypothetical protein